MNINELVNQVESLFSLPEVALRVNEILNSPEPLNDEIEAVIITDPAFTATILKIVNSAYFGFPSQIDTVSRAITIIGLKELRNLVFTVSVTTTFKGIPTELIDMDVFWYHSVTSGVLAKIIAKKLKRKESEKLFIGGLLHSVGKLIYFSQCPELSREVLAVKDRGEDEMIRVEFEKLGFSYAELGAAFLASWKLPESLCSAIKNHLDPLNADKFIADAAILHVAGAIANSIEPCAKHDFDFEELEPHFKPGVLEYLNITPNLLEYCINESFEQALDIMAVINPKAISIY